MTADMRHVHPIIRQIIGNIHVSQQYSYVLRTVIGKLKNGYSGFAAIPSEDKRHLIMDVLYQHATNQVEYVDVMSGGVGAGKARQILSKLP